MPAKAIIVNPAGCFITEHNGERSQRSPHVGQTSLKPKPIPSQIDIHNYILKPLGSPLPAFHCTTSCLYIPLLNVAPLPSPLSYLSTYAHNPISPKLAQPLPLGSCPWLSSS